MTLFDELLNVVFESSAIIYFVTLLLVEATERFAGKLLVVERLWILEIFVFDLLHEFVEGHGVLSFWAIILLG